MDGNVSFPDDLQHSYTYNADGTLATSTATDSLGNVWVKTYTYTSGNLTAETAWVKQ